MLRRVGLAMLFWCALAGGVVIDRIAVIVDKHVIKASDIDRDLRATEFLNRQPLDLSVEARRKAAERLIDQSVIRDEMEKGAYRRSSAADVEAMLARIPRDRYGGSAARLEEDLSRYGLTEDQLRIELAWQLDVLKFIDERFRPGVFVTDEEVRSYYDKNQPDLDHQFPGLKTFQAMEPKIRESLEGERLNQNFERWLAASRKSDHIEYREGAFQ